MECFHQRSELSHQHDREAFRQRQFARDCDQRRSDDNPSHLAKHCDPCHQRHVHAELLVLAQHEWVFFADSTFGKFTEQWTHLQFTKHPANAFGQFHVHTRHDEFGARYLAGFSEALVE